MNPRLNFLRLGAVLLAAATLLPAQRVRVVPAPVVRLPTHVDGNSPAFWSKGELKLFTSTGFPEMISSAPDLFGRWVSQTVNTSAHNHIPLWIESAWRDTDGTVFGWYHHEPERICGAANGLTSPKIGAVISFDEGETVHDLGIILESRYGPDCNAENGFFAGGHGDFSVVPDRRRQYFYIFFTNYGGPAGEQGVAVARLPFEHRHAPAGKVQKFYRGAWKEPGLGGRTTPLFPARTPWNRRDADSFWGPAVHYNTYLRQYVMLLNRACCAPGWPQQGVYISYGADPRNLLAWKYPELLLESDELPDRPAFYPQVLGLGPGETDSRAGEFARLFVQGVSRWSLTFGFLDGQQMPPDEEEQPEVPLPANPDQ